MRFIIESRNGNPSILMLQEDGTYKSIAHGHGEDSLPHIKLLCNMANGTASFVEVHG